MSFELKAWKKCRKNGVANMLTALYLIIRYQDWIVMAASNFLAPSLSNAGLVQSISNSSSAINGFSKNLFVKGSLFGNRGTLPSE